VIRGIVSTPPPRDRRGTAAALMIVTGPLPACSHVAAGFASEATALSGPIREP
jgi:hypothetical protein